MLCCSLNMNNQEHCHYRNCTTHTLTSCTPKVAAAPRVHSVGCCHLGHAAGKGVGCSSSSSSTSTHHTCQKSPPAVHFPHTPHPYQLHAQGGSSPQAHSVGCCDFDYASDASVKRARRHWPELRVLLLLSFTHVSELQHRPSLTSKPQLGMFSRTCTCLHHCGRSPVHSPCHRQDHDNHHEQHQHTCCSRATVAQCKPVPLVASRHPAKNQPPPSPEPVSTTTAVVASIVPAAASPAVIIPVTPASPGQLNLRNRCGHKGFERQTHSKAKTRSHPCRPESSLSRLPSLDSATCGVQGHAWMHHVRVAESRNRHQCKTLQECKGPTTPNPNTLPGPHPSLSITPPLKSFSHPQPHAQLLVPVSCLHCIIHVIRVARR
jgi:hypothetical protein